MSRIRFALKFLLVTYCVLLAVPASASEGTPVARVGRLSVIGQGGGAPDDIVIGSDDTIYFTDQRSSRVMRLSPSGNPEQVSPPIVEPEGIAIMPDGTLIVMEQGTNRLLRLNPKTRQLSLFYTIHNPMDRLGIDGIAINPRNGDLIVPNAPTGQILSFSADASSFQVLASGFDLPISAIQAEDGTLYICEKLSHKIYRVTSDHRTTLLTTLSLPDDIIFDRQGNLLVNALDGNIWRIDPNTGQKTVLVSGLSAPHGISLDSKGNIIIADFTLNRFYRLTLPPVSAIPTAF